jgi:DNA-binding NtrC family response regulator
MVAHVLVLIEDPEESSVICDHLAEEGYRCTTAETIDEAETVLDRLGVDLVITDIGSTQPPAIERLLTLAERRRIPAILIAGEGVPADASQRVRVLRSPLRVSDLLAGVSEVLERGALAGEQK